MHDQHSRHALHDDHLTDDSHTLQPALLATLITTLLTTPLLFLALILHGAAITTHLRETALASLHLALLSTPPLLHVRGVDGPAWRALVSLRAPLDAPAGAALGTLLGAWVGALPIPLDWDRPWQRWPVTIVAGGYVGWAVGLVGGGTVGRGRQLGGLL